MAEFVVKSALAMQKLGQSMAADFLDGGILALFGDLGSGKTTFAQGFAKGLGVERRIISPTFVIVRSYMLQDIRSKKQELRSKEEGFRNFYHIDLYRVESEKDLEGLGLKEILADENNIVLVEWAEKLGGLLPDKGVEVRFERVSEAERRVKIRNC